MSLIQFALAALAVLLAGLVLDYLWQSRGKRESLPVAAKRSLVTPAERSFLQVLEEAIGDDYRVYAKVRAADVLAVPSEADRSRRQQAFDRIADRPFDFLLCTQAELVVQAAIEFDSSTQGDDDIGALCRSAQLPLLRFDAKRSYSVGEVRREVLSAMSAPYTPELGPADTTVAPADNRTPTLPPLE